MRPPPTAVMNTAIGKCTGKNMPGVPGKHERRDGERPHCTITLAVIFGWIEQK